jgi:hypothetical protein
VGRCDCDAEKEIPMTEPMSENGTTSGHRRTVIIFVRVPDYPEPVRVVGVLLHKNGVPFALVDQIGTRMAAILPDKMQLDSPPLLVAP